MTNVARAFFCVLLMFALVSCVTSSIMMDNLNPIHREMNHDEFTAKIALKAVPKAEFAIDNQGVSYSVEIYDMQTGTTTSTTMVWHPLYPYGGFMSPITTTVPVYTDYFFLFDSSGLAYWGFMNELQKADDQSIQQLAPLIMSQYSKYLEEKRAVNEKVSAPPRSLH